MQTFMHSPHLTHLFRNSCSSRDPGGRIKVASENPVFDKTFERIRGTVMRPAAIDAMTFRLPKSIAGDLSAFAKPKLIAFCGHRSSQSMQAMHSDFLHSSALSVTAPPWHCRAHTPQEVHPSPTDLLRNAYLERIPSNAPSGQRYLHQKRFS